MDSFELNKIAGAILGTFLLIMIVNKISAGIVHEDIPEKPGYQVDIAIQSDAGAEEEEENIIPINVRLISGNIENGLKQAKKCLSCHLFNEDGGNRTGPNLHGVVGRALGAAEGFAYSNALKSKIEEIGQWGYEQLDQFLHKPKQYIPKTSMNFVGIKDPQKRADLILYLKSVSPNAPEIPVAEINKTQDKTGMSNNDNGETEMSNEAEMQNEAEKTE